MDQILVELKSKRNTHLRRTFEAEEPEREAEYADTHQVLLFAEDIYAVQVYRDKKGAPLLNYESHVTFYSELADRDWGVIGGAYRKEEVQAA